MSDTKLRIFDAISDIFDEGGLQKVTMSTIAARCSMNKGSLFYYFASKEDMLRQFYEYYLETKDNEFYRQLTEYVDTHSRSVESFCRLIDKMLTVDRGNASMKDIVSSDILYIASKDEAINKLLLDKYSRLEQAFVKLIRSYEDSGILEMSRMHRALDDLLFVLCGILYLELNNMKLYTHEETLALERMHVKRNFIKDELQHEIV